MDQVVSPRKRNKPNSEPLVCPVCGITLRSSEIEHHFMAEIEKLQKLSGGRSRKSTSHSPVDTAGSSSSNTNNVNGEGSSKANNSNEDCWGTYQKIKSNRQNRLKIKPKKRKTNDMTCPVCNQCPNEDITSHVEKCLKDSESGTNGRRTADSDDESTIDVEGETYEEYEWAGQTRIRAAGLLPGGYSATGIGTRITPASDDENDVNVDGDDNVYGPPQFSERDVIVPISKDECNSYLRDLVIGNEPPNIRNDTVKEGSHSKTSLEIKSSSNNEPPEPLKTTLSNVEHSDTNHVIESLKAKIREYECYVQNKPKCLICMDDFKLPVVSICCWHVYCQECWLNSLGSKKLCPQCNSITGPTDLRRIYL